MLMSSKLTMQGSPQGVPTPQANFIPIAARDFADSLPSLGWRVSQGFHCAYAVMCVLRQGTRQVLKISSYFFLITIAAVR